MLITFAQVPKSLDELSLKALGAKMSKAEVAKTSARRQQKNVSAIFLCSKAKSKLSVKAGLLGEVNDSTVGLVDSAVKATEFSAVRRKSLDLWCKSKDSHLSRVRLFGLGDVSSLETQAVRVNYGGWLFQRIKLADEPKQTQLFFHAEANDISAEQEAELMADFAFGAMLRDYEFKIHHGELKTAKSKKSPKLEKRALTFYCQKPALARKIYARHQAVEKGVRWARDLVSEPPNHLTPDLYATRISETLKPLGVKVKVLGEPALKKLGMGALLSVAAGSEAPPRVVVMEWQGGKKTEPPRALIGKGVTFDSGGLSLKPPAAMEDMKFDMGGSAAVVGAMRALAERKAKANVVGLVGLVENMPSGAALRPGDVVTSMSGQTIEVLNTDAEGRLVLADLLWYAHQTFKPSAMVNLATLTGAIIVTLGQEIAGLFSNSDEVSVGLSKAGYATGERVWRLPLDPIYDKQLDCQVANMKNIGDRGSAGSIVAAQFLKRFVGTCKWAHLDIAGVVWRKKDMDLSPRGATGFGVRLLDEWIESAKPKPTSK